MSGGEADRLRSAEWQRLLVLLADSGRFLIRRSDAQDEVVSRTNKIVRALDAFPAEIDRWVEQLTRLGLLESTDDTFRLTERGLDRVDRVYRDEGTSPARDTGDVSDPPTVRIGILVVSLLSMYLVAVLRLTVSPLAILFLLLVGTATVLAAVRSTLDVTVRETTGGSIANRTREQVLSILRKWGLIDSSDSASTASTDAEEQDASSDEGDETKQYEFETE